MSESAFGVDHGEDFSKAFKMPGSFKPKMPTNPLKSAGGAHAGPAGPKPFGGGGMVGQARGAMGAQHKGPSAMKKPAAVGGAVGGGAAAGGYAAYRAAQQKKMKKPGQV